MTLTTRLSRGAPALILFSVLLILGAPPRPSLAGSIPLRWDRATAPDLAGYQIYYGTTPGTYPFSVNVGNRTSYTLGGLTDCQKYYIAVKAYTTAGTLSRGYSNELVGLPTPVISSVQPASAAQGQLTPIVVTGMNFDRGAALAFSDPSIAVDGATSGSCTQVQSSISIGLEALAGWAPVTVRNPDHSRGVSNAALRILPASAPTVVSTSPVEGTAGIAPSVRPTVTFSQPMDPRSVTAASLRLLGPGGTPVAQMPGSPTFDPGGRTATIVPVSPLAPGALYQIDVSGSSDGVLDGVGRPMAAEFLQVPGFTTVASGAASRAEAPSWFDDGDSLPTIHALSSSDGPIGSYVAVLGDDFGPNGGSVFFGAAPAQVVSWTSRKIVAVVPAAASGPIRVRTAAGVVSGGSSFTLGPGAVRHLSGSAPAGGDGSAAKPWNSFAAADAAVAPGDFVVVHGGRYRAATGQDAVFQANTSGAPGLTITYFANPGDVVYLDANAAAKQAIRVGGDDVTVVGFVAAGATYQGIALVGQNATAIDNEVKDGAPTAGVGQGVVVAGQGGRAVGNYVHDNYGAGLLASATNVIVSDNYIAASGKGALDSRGIGIQVQLPARTSASQTARIGRNFVTGSHRSGILVGAYSVGTDIFENIVTRNGEHCVSIGSGAVGTIFRNNVCYENSTADPAGGISAIALASGGAQGATVTNNAVAGRYPISRDKSFGGDVEVDYNFYDLEAALFMFENHFYDTLDQWRSATGLDTNSQMGQPLYLNPVLDEFQPTLGSQMIDAGTSAWCPRVPTGGACDVGAYEVAP